VLVLEPTLSKRYAELLELTLMTMIIKRAAERTVHGLHDDIGPGSRGESLKKAAAVMGILALTSLLAVELVAAAASRGWEGVRPYFTRRDMAAGPGVCYDAAGVHHAAVVYGAGGGFTRALVQEELHEVRR